MPDNTNDKIQMVSNMVHEFSSAYSSSTEGKFSKVKQNLSKEPISVKTRRYLISVFAALNK